MQIAPKLILLLIAISYSLAFKQGEVVKMSVKSTPAVGTPQWTEVLGKNCPRFGVRRQVQLPINKQNLEDLPKVDFKLTFAFDGERFITPYFLITNTKDVFIEHIEFVFVYSGNDIVDLKWYTHYNDEDKDLKGLKNSGVPSSVFLMFRWQEFEEKDTSLGIGFLLFTGFVCTIVMMIYVSVDSHIKGIKMPPVNRGVSSSAAVREVPKKAEPVAVQNNGTLQMEELPESEVLSSLPESTEVRENNVRENSIKED